MTASPSTERSAGRALALVSTAVFLASSNWFSGAAAAPLLRDAWNLGAGGMAWLTISVQLGFIAGTLLYALLNIPDLFKARRVFAVSALAGAAFNLGFALAGGFAPALLFRFLTGASLAGVYPVGLKIVAQWHRTGLGWRLGIMVGSLTLGTSVPYLLFAAGSRMKPGELLVAASGLALVGGVLVVFGLRDGPYLTESAPFDWRVSARLLRNRPFRLQAFGYFGHMWELYAFWALAASYLGAALSRNSPGAEAGAGGLVFLVFLAGVAGCIAAGWISRRSGERRVALGALAVSGTCCALSPAFFGAPAWALIPFSLVWGAAVIADSAQFSGLAVRTCPPEYTGTALTVQNGIGFAVTVVSIQLVAAAVSWIGWRWALLLLLPGPLAGILALSRFKVPADPQNPLPV